MMSRKSLSSWCLMLISLAVQADLDAGIEAVARRDFAAALAEFKPLAEKGDVAAQVNLGNLYMKGLGVRQNYVEALRWYRNAAEQNEPMAQSKLGILYYYGLGVAQDYAEAGLWFRKAADQGESGAQAVLGSLYALGEGLPRDYAQAYYWYSLAAEQGNPDALAGRASIVDEMTPGQMDEALRLLAEARRRTAEVEAQAIESTEPGPEARSQESPGDAKNRKSQASGHKKAGQRRRESKAAAIARGEKERKTPMR